MNIVWKEPDGFISVTHLTPEAIAHIEAAKALQARNHLSPQEITYVNFVRDNIGLSEHEHELILVSRAKTDWEKAGSPPAQRPEILDFTCVAHSAPLPARDFRDAWSFDGARVVIDTGKAKEITKERLRIERAPLFEANDLKLRDAILAGDKDAMLALTKERDRLRDITKEVDAAASLDELRLLTAIDSPTSTSTVGAK